MPNNGVLEFSGFLLNSQDVGTDEHMVSILYFQVHFNGHAHGPFELTIKQPVGGTFESAFEVAPPHRVPVPYTQLREIAEEYFRGCVGPTGTVFGSEPGATNTSIRHCYGDKTVRYDVDLIDELPAGW